MTTSPSFSPTVAPSFRPSFAPNTAPVTTSSSGSNDSGGFSVQYVALLFVMLFLGVLFVKLVSMLIFLILDSDKSRPIPVEVNVTTIRHAEVVRVSKLNSEDDIISLYNKPWNPTSHTTSNEAYALYIADLNLPSAILMALAYDEDQVQCVLTGTDQVIQPILVPYSTILEFREREAERQKEREKEELKNKANTSTNNNIINNRSSSPAFSSSSSARSSTVSSYDGAGGVTSTGAAAANSSEGRNSPDNINAINSPPGSRQPIVRIASFEGRWDSIQGHRARASMARRHTAELQLPAYLYDSSGSNGTDGNNGINTSRYLAARNQIHASSLNNINTSTGSLSGFGLPSIRHSNLSTTATPLATSTAGTSITQRLRAVSVLIFPGLNHENHNTTNGRYNGEHRDSSDGYENDGNDSARAMLSSSSSPFGINNSSINNNNSSSSSSENNNNINTLMRRLSLPELPVHWINSSNNNNSNEVPYAVNGEPLMPLAEVMSDDALLQEELNTVQITELNPNQGELL